MFFLFGHDVLVTVSMRVCEWSVSVSVSVYSVVNEVCCLGFVRVLLCECGVLECVVSWMSSLACGVDVLFLCAPFFSHPSGDPQLSQFLTYLTHTPRAWEVCAWRRT